MRKLIRNKNTKQFLNKNGQWTDDLALAHDFTANPTASNIVAVSDDVELFYYFEDLPQRKYDFTIELH